MSTTTILQSNEQKKLYPDFHLFASNENKSISDLLLETSYQHSSTSSANSFSAQNSTWESFRNELEFE